MLPALRLMKEWPGFASALSEENMKLLLAILALVLITGCGSVMVKQKTCKPHHMEMNGDVISECDKA